MRVGRRQQLGDASWEVMAGLREGRRRLGRQSEEAEVAGAGEQGSANGWVVGDGRGGLLVEAATIRGCGGRSWRRLVLVAQRERESEGRRGLSAGEGGRRLGKGRGRGGSERLETRRRRLLEEAGQVKGRVGDGGGWLELIGGERWTRWRGAGVKRESGGGRRRWWWSTSAGRPAAEGREMTDAKGRGG